MISNHPRQNPAIRRLTGWFVRLVIGLSALAGVGILLVAVLYTLPLVALMVVFLAGLNVPLLLLTSLHPDVELHEDGLRLMPLVWPSQFVRWDELAHTTPHSLLKPPPPERSIIKEKPQEGLMVVAQRGSLAWHWRLVGLMAGHGWSPVFGIASHTHTDYPALRRHLKKNLPHKEPS